MPVMPGVQHMPGCQGCQWCLDFSVCQDARDASDAWSKAKDARDASDAWRVLCMLGMPVMPGIQWMPGCQGCQGCLEFSICQDASDAWSSTYAGMPGMPVCESQNSNPGEVRKIPHPPCLKNPPSPFSISDIWYLFTCPPPPPSTTLSLPGPLELVDRGNVLLAWFELISKTDLWDIFMNYRAAVFSTTFLIKERLCVLTLWPF